MHEVKSIQDLPSQINRDEILLPEFQNGYVCEVVGRSAPENILGAAEAKAQKWTRRRARGGSATDRAPSLHAPGDHQRRRGPAVDARRRHEATPWSRSD